MWLLPSRRRPENLARFFEAYRQTNGSTPGMVLIDMADYAANCEAYDALELPPAWFFHYTTGETQGEKIAEVWDNVKDCSWLGLIGDDCVPETPHWDTLLLERLNGANIVSCNDGHLAPQRLGNCWIMAGPLVRAVGYIFPPGLDHLYVDDVWETIGREAGCWTIAMAVMVRHKHVLFGEATADETHDKVYGAGFGKPGAKPAGMWAGDSQVFGDWMTEERHIAVDVARKLQPEMPAMPAVHTAERTQEERFEYAKSRKVMILTPVARAPCWQYTWAFGHTISLLERLKIEWDARFVVGLSNLPRARNELAARFMAATADDPTAWDSLWIDDDMNWEPSAVIRLLASEQPFVAAVGRKRIERPNTDPSVWCAYLPDGQERDEMGNISAPGAKCGGAFMRVRREVFSRLAAAHPEWKRAGMPHMSPEVAAEYFQYFIHEDSTLLSSEMEKAGHQAQQRGESIAEIYKAIIAAASERNDGGEDYTFCERWNAIGGRVWIDPAITLGHVGEKEYAGALGELTAEPDANPHMEMLSASRGQSIAA